MEEQECTCSRQQLASSVGCNCKARKWRTLNWLIPAVAALALAYVLVDKPNPEFQKKTTDFWGIETPPLKAHRERAFHAAQQETAKYPVVNDSTTQQ